MHEDWFILTPYDCPDADAIVDGVCRGHVQQVRHLVQVGWISDNKQDSRKPCSSIVRFLFLTMATMGLPWTLTKDTDFKMLFIALENSMVVLTTDHVSRQLDHLKIDVYNLCRRVFLKCNLHLKMHHFIVLKNILSLLYETPTAGTAYSRSVRLQENSSTHRSIATNRDNMVGHHPHLQLPGGHAEIFVNAELVHVQACIIVCVMHLAFGRVDHKGHDWNLASEDERLSVLVLLNIAEKSQATGLPQLTSRRMITHVSKFQTVIRCR